MTKKSGVGMNIYYWCAYKMLVRSNKFHLFNLKSTYTVPMGPSPLLLNKASKILNNTKFQ